MNFLDKMNEYASACKADAVEIPQETNDVASVSDTSLDVSKDAPSLKEMVETGEIYHSWTKVNTSPSCGCNNACFHSCMNIG